MIEVKATKKTILLRSYGFRFNIWLGVDGMWEVDKLRRKNPPFDKMDFNTFRVYTTIALSPECIKRTSYFRLKSLIRSEGLTKVKRGRHE